MSAQSTLFDSCLTDYVQACLQNGAQIVKRTKGVIGMVLCPKCNSEKDLRHVHEQGEFTGYVCGCGHKFSSEDAAILTFKTA